MSVSIFFTAAMIRAFRHGSLQQLTRVWEELEYRIDVYLVTRGAHIEHLKL
jgi:hypothetical protein